MPTKNHTKKQLKQQLKNQRFFNKVLTEKAEQIQQTNDILTYSVLGASIFLSAVVIYTESRR